MNNPGTGQQVTTTFYTFFLMMIPFIIVNYQIAKRKSVKPMKFLLLSLIPIVNYCTTVYLISLPDLDLKNKIERIYEKIIVGKD